MYFFLLDFIYWRKRLLPVAHAFEGRLQVVMSDEIEYNDELRELGYGDHGDDLVIALWANKKEKYVMKEDFDADSLKYFAEVFVIVVCRYCKLHQCQSLVLF